jgi:NTP pyrophosphatase (non-canonical NTP hydrolase)
MNSEQRPVDHAQEAQGIAAEAAELAEHIRDSNPQYRREELLDELVEMIDDAHEAAVTAQIQLDDE